MKYKVGDFVTRTSNGKAVGVERIVKINKVTARLESLYSFRMDTGELGAGVVLVYRHSTDEEIKTYTPFRLEPFPEGAICENCNRYFYYDYSKVLHGDRKFHCSAYPKPKNDVEKFRYRHIPDWHSCKGNENLKKSERNFK